MKELRALYGWVIWSMVTHTLDTKADGKTMIYRTEHEAQEAIRKLKRGLAKAIKVPLFKR